MSFTSWWNKKGLGKKHPWAVVNPSGLVTDYNQSYMTELRAKLSDIESDFSDAELLELNRDELKLHRARMKRSDKEWVDLILQDGMLVARDFNTAFANSIRKKSGFQFTDDVSDEDVVKAYIERENIEREEPRLEVVHSGIDPDGKLRIELDWNQAFINLLKKNGIVGETEDEAIQEYLSRLTPTNELTNEMIDEAYGELDSELQAELSQATDMLEKAKKGNRL